MELKSISEIRQMNEAELNDYFHHLVVVSGEHSYPWPASSILDILSTIRNFEVDLMISELVFNYVRAYMLENLDRARLSFLGDNFLFSDQYKILKMAIGNDNAQITYIILTVEQLDLLLSDVSYIQQNDCLPDDFITRVELEIEIQTQENKDQIVSYLLSLGMINIEDAEYIIPEPSATLDVDTTTERFSSAIWFQAIQDKDIILGGVGGIGSYVAFLLSRMHPNKICIYDDDIVETVNMAGQLYSDNDVGSFKVDATASRALSMSRYTSIYSIRERYTEETQTCDVMICGFDNMEARKTFFKNWVEHVISKPDEQKKKCLFIDGRLAAEEFQVLCIRGDDSFNMGRYEQEFLFSDAEADETQCSYKQTSYMANMIGSVMINLFTNFVANSIEDNIRELPFFTKYDGSTMTFKTELQYGRRQNRKLYSKQHRQQI